MDPTVTSGIIGAGALVLSGAIARLVSRPARRLNEAQATDLETSVAERVVRMQESENLQLLERIRDLELEVGQLKERTAQRERELQRDLDSVRGERDGLLVEINHLRGQITAKELELAAARKEASDMHLVALTQAQAAPAAVPVMVEGSTP